MGDNQISVSMLKMMNNAIPMKMEVVLKDT
jgi:hypothetical protein